jgi:hypothetical protein
MFVHIWHLQLKNNHSQLKKLIDMQIPCYECDPLNAIQKKILIKISSTKVLHLCFFVLIHHIPNPY